ncbi:MAG: response regulator [Mariniphaga sp.]|nr:response regulator [Mariniphaga sp.]
MQNQDSPLIFIVEDNSIYNKFIASHLRSNKFERIESFLSGEDCLKNLYKKPDIVIQDYLLNGISGIDVLKTTRKTNPSTEFIFLSGQDNLSIAVNTIKNGAFDYVVKDRFALKKLIDNIDKIMKQRNTKSENQNHVKGITLFFIALALLILSIVSLAVFFPKAFPF